MRYNHGDTGLAAAFAAVRQYDPATYARMETAPWHISTDPFSDLFDFEFTLTLLRMAETAMTSDGITLPLNAGGVIGNPYAMTFINTAEIQAEADHDKVSATLAMATALVHEFTHYSTQGHNEIEAFEAAIAFGSLLPDPDGTVIKRWDADTLAIIKAHPEQYPVAVD